MDQAHVHVAYRSARQWSCKKANFSLPDCHFDRLFAALLSSLAPAARKNSVSGFQCFCMYEIAPPVMTDSAPDFLLLKSVASTNVRVLPSPRAALLLMQSQSLFGTQRELLGLGIDLVNRLELLQDIAHFGRE